MVLPLLGAGLGLIGTLIGASKQKQAVASQNKTNLQLNSDNNATNIQLAKEANEANAALALADFERNREADLDNQVNGPARLIEAAEAAGLHPLALLGGNHASYTGNGSRIFTPGQVAAQTQAGRVTAVDATSMGPAFAAFGEALGDAANTRLQNEQLKRQNQNLESSLPGVQRLGAPAKAGGHVVTSRVTATEAGIEAAQDKPATWLNEDPVDGVSRPPMRPTGDGFRDYVAVFDPSGNPIELERSVADRLRIEQHDYLMAEDYEAIFGEIGGEAMSVTSIRPAADTLFNNDRIFVGDRGTPSTMTTLWEHVTEGETAGSSSRRDGR